MTVRQQANLDGQIAEMRSRSSSMATEIETLSHTLSGKAQVETFLMRTFCGW